MINNAIFSLSLFLLLFLFLLCNFIVTKTTKLHIKNKQKDQSTYIFCSMINNAILLLSLFLLLFLFLLCNFVVATTTKLHIKKNKQKDQSTYIFCSIINNSIEEADYSQTYLVQMYPLVEASCDQEQYYVRSASHSDRCKVTLTFTV